VTLRSSLTLTCLFLAACGAGETGWGPIPDPVLITRNEYVVLVGRSNFVSLGLVGGYRDFKRPKGRCEYSAELLFGSLPAGITLNESLNPAFVGTPPVSAVGRYRVQIRVKADVDVARSYEVSTRQVVFVNVVKP
jgi:hypothetical protein